MKKLISVVAAVAMSAAVFAMDITLGARGNLNLNAGTTLANSFYNDEIDLKDFNYKVTKNLVVGGGFGFYGNFGLANIESVVIGVQPELCFNFNNGMSMKSEFSPETYESKYTTNTLDIPVLFTANISLNDKMKLGFGLGPNYSFVLGGSGKDVFTYDSVSLSTEYKDWKDYVSKNSTNLTYKGFRVNYGMALDANFGFNLGPGALVADLRWFIDFTPTALKTVDNKGHKYHNEFFYRRSLNFGAGYEIKL